MSSITIKPNVTTERFVKIRDAQEAAAIKRLAGFKTSIYRGHRDYVVRYWGKEGSSENDVSTLSAV